MKKIIVLFLSVFTLFGCGEELEFNTPAFQGEKDGNLWEATTYKANINNSGVLTITGSDNFETITLKVNSTALGIHDIVETSSFATLKDINDVLYSSENTPDPSVQLYPAAGAITLTEVNLVERYVSGEFYFNAFNNSGLTSINVNKGFFHKVPIISVAVDGSGEVSAACTSASVVVAATLVNFNAVTPGDTNYADVCNQYKSALTNQKIACGDDNGLIQATIDGLDCAATGLTSSITVEVDGVARTFDTNISVNLVGITKTVIAEDSVNTDFIQFDLEQGQTGTDIVSNFLIVLNGQNHEPIPGNMTLGEFTTTIISNTNTNIEGTFSGAINDYNGGNDKGLSMGIININY